MREHMTEEKHRRNCKMKKTEEAELPQRITAFTVFAIKIKTECSDTTGGFSVFFSLPAKQFSLQLRFHLIPGIEFWASQSCGFHVVQDSNIFPLFP